MLGILKNTGRVVTKSFTKCYNILSLYHNILYAKYALPKVGLKTVISATFIWNINVLMHYRVKALACLRIALNCRNLSKDKSLIQSRGLFKVVSI